MLGLKYYLLEMLIKNVVMFKVPAVTSMKEGLVGLNKVCIWYLAP